MILKGYKIPDDHQFHFDFRHKDGHLAQEAATLMATTKRNVLAISYCAKWKLEIEDNMVIGPIKYNRKWFSLKRFNYRFRRLFSKKWAENYSQKLREKFIEKHGYPPDNPKTPLVEFLEMAKQAKLNQL